jgi:hypothetical protein
MSFEAKVAIFYVSLMLLLLGVVLYLGSCKNTPTNTPTNTGWVISNDLTPNNKQITTNIITDPSGQKFLIVSNNRGMTLIPYKEITPTPLKPE